MKITKANGSHIPGIIDARGEFARFHEPYDPRYPLIGNVREGFWSYLVGLMTAKDTSVLVALDRKKVIGYTITVMGNSLRRGTPARNKILSPVPP